MTILGADGGSFKSATALYAADAGAWVEIPLGGGEPAGWTRPTDWLTTSVTAGEQKIQCLLAIGPDTTSETERVMTILCVGAYTVDWGDGTAPQNFATNAPATHLYDPANLAGTLTSTGWLQALMTITPQGAGTLSTLDFQRVYYTGKNWKSPVIEFVSGPTTLTTIVCGNFTPMLQRIEFKNPLIIGSFQNMFNGCFNLREVAGEIRTGGAVNGCFQNCALLTKFPTITLTGTNINASLMFGSCQSMVEPPLMSGAANIITWTSTFSTCTAMKRLPDGFICAGATSTQQMFQSCVSLEELPLLDTALSTTGNAMFQSCYSLRKVSFTSTALMNNVINMFASCYSLEELSGLDFSAVTSAANAAAFSLNHRLSKIGFLAGKAPLYSFNIGNAFLDGPALDAVYTALPTTSGQTITVTNLPGTLSDTPTIATAKGWTVTGS